MKNIFLQLLLFLFSLFFIDCKKDFTVYKAQNGILDLRNWNQDQESVISLDGTWEFYWNGFYQQSDLEKLKPELINLPSIWNDKIIDEKKISGSGFATFRLKILLPEKQIPTLAIRVKPLTSCRVFINETELNCIGSAGKDVESSIPDTRPSFAAFVPQKNTLDVIVQVSNFHHRKGGFLYSIYFGTESGLLKYIESIRSRDNFILGFLFFVILYHIGLYFIRRRESLSIYFTLLVLCIFLRTASTGEKLLVDFVNIGYPIYVAIEYLTFFLVLPLALQFINLMFSLRIPKWILTIIFGIGIFFSIVTVFTETIFYSNLINIYLPIFILELISAYLLVAFAVRKKKENASIILIGFTIMLICTINDILNTTEVIHTSYLAHYGLISVVSSQSLFLLLRFVKAFRENEALSADLKKINEELETRIIERTKEIMEEKIIAVKANELKDKFISLLSHDLRSPIGNAKMLIESSIEADNESEKDLSRSYLDLAVNSINNALEMTKKILQFSQTNSGNIELNIQACYPARVVDKIFNIMLSRIREKKIQLLNFVSEDEKIETDEALLQEIILNLVSNSIKFSRPGDFISVRTEIKGDKYLLFVKDTGIGIPNDVKINLFSHSIKTSSIGTGGEIGTGLGLPLCRDIAKMLKGEIHLNDNVTDGTEFIIQLPLVNTSRLSNQLD
ncbi:MAG: sensor histidine kinase [Leptospiraceae bacterium]|nr:sensor histidine kinase [Leptospiraceae bacterium]